MQALRYLWFLVLASSMLVMISLVSYQCIKMKIPFRLEEQFTAQATEGLILDIGMTQSQLTKLKLGVLVLGHARIKVACISKL